MASNKEYLDFILEQLSLLEEIKVRKMMGEYIIYYKNKIIGGIYDNRFLVKQTPLSKNLIPNASLEKPYDGGKEMILVDNIENKEFLKTLFVSMYDELPKK